MLEILADRASTGRFAGEILFDGGLRSTGFAPSYVAQEDSLLGSFSVRETFLYTAALTLPLDTGLSKRREIVAKMITDLGLESCADTKVGDIFVKGLSGGQKRRLSLGLSLITNPILLILDEPTSGLDGAASFEIMTLLANLAKQRRIAVLCTIHQPSSDIWSLFDKVSLLSAGRQIYFGAAADAVPYFSSINQPCPQLCNPADFFLRLINTDFIGHGDVDQLELDFKSNLLPRLSTLIQASKKTNIPAVSGASAPTSICRNGGIEYLWQFSVLAHRNFLNTLRNPGVILIRLVMYFMLAVMIGGMFYRNGRDSSDKALQGRVACLFFVFAFMVFMSIAVLPFYMWDRPTYLRERFNGDYQVGPFVLAQVTSNIPGVFMIALASALPVVYMCEWNNFGYFLLILFLSLMCAEGYMAVLGAIVPHFIIGIALGAGLYGFFMLCEGFFQIKSDIPPWFIWVYYMGFHTYSFRAAVVNEFKGRGDLDHANNPQWATGQDLLNYYNMGDAKVGDDCWVLFGYACAWYILYYIVLLNTTGKK